MKYLLFLIIALICHCSFARKSSYNPLRFGINTDFAMPLVQIKRNDPPQLQNGILKDLGEALSKEMKLKPVWVLLPKKRVAPSLLSSDASIICHINEVWQPALKEKALWSHDLYRATNVIVFTKKKVIRSVQDLSGERIGTVLNFIYTNLDPHFAKGDIKRENGPNNESNIQKLIHDRISYIVMSNLEFNYYKKIHPQLNFADLGMDTVTTKCALSRKGEVSLAQVNKAIDAIKKNGTLDRILTSY